MKIKILLADDHQIIREGLGALMAGQPDFEVVGQVASGAEAVAQALAARPHVIVMDISMPDMNGIEATRQVLKQSPQTRVIALSVHRDRRYVAGMLQAGARGYLLKDCAFDELIEAIRVVASGRRYLSPAVAGEVVDDYVARLDAQKAHAAEPLTTRERAVLQMLAEGKSTKEIAGALNVSPKTIETFRKQIMEKLNLFTVAELTKYAVREGLTALE